MARAKKDTLVTDMTPIDTANVTETQEVAAEAVATVAKSTAEKLAAARALVAKYERELANEQIKNDIQPGDDIEFNFGRGDKSRVLTGKVTATKDVPEGTLKGLNLLVTSGEGFDAEQYRVHVRDVTKNTTGDARRGAEKPVEQPEGETDPLDNAG